MTSVTAKRKHGARMSYLRHLGYLLGVSGADPRLVCPSWQLESSTVIVPLPFKIARTNPKCVCTWWLVGVTASSS